jgi:pimeloyl-ACP methyl ester carboxylesterase
VEIALHHPDRVDRVVLLDPTPPREQGPPAAIRAVLHGAVPALVRSADALRLLAAADRLLTRRWHRHGTAIDPRSFRDPGTWTQLWAELEAGWDRARRVDADLVTRSLAHRPDLLVPVPVTSAARRSQQRLAARLGATLHPVVGSGHLVMCDRPDAVVDALLVGPPRTTGGTGG